MGVITQAMRVQATIDVSDMGPAQEVPLADEIPAQQLSGQRHIAPRAAAAGA